MMLAVMLAAMMSSLTSIFNSVSNYKKILREKFEEDVVDFYNEDYHLINKPNN